MRWAVDGDVVLYSVCFAAKDDPFSFAARSVRVFLENLMATLNADGIDVYLTGEGNYRKELGCDAYPYKGTRKKEKPPHFYEMREYLIENLGAIEINGKEADDALATAACQLGHGIATIDKDLWGVPGWHYNWNKQEVSCVSPEAANRVFYTQLLSGDSSDNIPGLFKRLGKKVTKKVLEPLDWMTEPTEMYDYVYKVYSEAYDNVGMCLDDKVKVLDDWLLRQGRQLWMQRSDGEMWNAPKS